MAPGRPDEPNLYWNCALDAPDSAIFAHFRKLGAQNLSLEGGPGVVRATD